MFNLMQIWLNMLDVDVTYMRLPQPNRSPRKHTIASYTLYYTRYNIIITIIIGLILEIIHMMPTVMLS